LLFITKSNARLLRDHLDANGYGRRDTVFSTPTGSVMRDDNFRPRIWRPAVKEALSVPDSMTFHDLRHTHVALCIESGMDLKSIQRRLGHSSIKTTGDLYAHLLDSVTKRAVDALEALPQGLDED
jgi:integrase